MVLLWDMRVEYPIVLFAIFVRQLPPLPTRYYLNRKHLEVVPMKPFIALTATFTAFAFTAPAWGGGDYGYWDRSKQEYWDGPCLVKIESKPYEYKKEVKCEDGFSPVADAPWKEEYRDGECKVKREAKYNEFKEEIKCR